MSASALAMALGMVIGLASAQLGAPLNLHVVASGHGPQPSITCPSSAVAVATTADLQAAVTARPAGTTFCLKAGVHAITSPTTPKTGDVFIGEYGAILDGSGWVTTDANAAAFMAQNADVDDVTIRNLVIRKMPQQGIHAFKDHSDRWTLENNEIANNKIGVQWPSGAIVRGNYIHHNVGVVDAGDPAARGGGYGGYLSANVLVEDNEIAFNGQEQKVLSASGITFRNNFVHHNLADGIWYDGDAGGALIEGNRVEDNARNGIFYEASSGPATIRGNTVRRQGDTGVFISNSRNADVGGNTIEDNFRAVTYFVDCNRVVVEGYELSDTSAHDNTIRVGSQAGAFATGLVWVGCSSTQLAVYLNGAKNLTFTRNAYDVPTVAGAWWVWGGLKTWAQWQAVGHDATGSVF